MVVGFAVRLRLLSWKVAKGYGEECYCLFPLRPGFRAWTALIWFRLFEFLELLGKAKQVLEHARVVCCYDIIVLSLCRTS